MDLSLTRVFSFILSVTLFTACRTSYTTTHFIAESEIGYETTIFSPLKDSIQGDFIYLSDSNERITSPTPLMKSYLNKNFRVILPERWGMPGKSMVSLDSYENRLRGVTYSLSQYRSDKDTLLPLHVLGEGFYSPIALQTAKDYRSPVVYLIQPIGIPLETILVEQYLNKQDTLQYSLPALLGLINDSLKTHFIHVIEKKNGESEEIFINHGSAFLRSYWKTEHVSELVERQTDTLISVIMHPFYPIQSKSNVEYWNRNGYKVKWPDLEIQPHYSIQYWEELILKEN